MARHSQADRPELPRPAVLWPSHRRKPVSSHPNSVETWIPASAGMTLRGSSADRRVCALVSGGVDSAALIAFLLKKRNVVYPVYVKSGYRWERAELYWLRRLLAAMSHSHLKPLTCLESPARIFFPKNHWAFAGRAVPDARSADESVYLPGRNLLLISKASIFCVDKNIWTFAMGTLLGNPFPDASPAFFSGLERVLKQSFGRSFRIWTPFRRMSKKEVVRRAGTLPWRLTFSCLAPSGNNPCGRCNKCEERRKALDSIAAQVRGRTSRRSADIDGPRRAGKPSPRLKSRL